MLFGHVSREQSFLRVEPREGDPGYGIVVYEQSPSCPMCRETRWEHVEWRPFSQLLDDVGLAVENLRPLGCESGTCGGWHADR